MSTANPSCIEAEPQFMRSRHYNALARTSQLSADACDIRAKGMAEAGDEDNAQTWRDMAASWRREVSYYRSRAKDFEGVPA